MLIKPNAITREIVFPKKYAEGMIERGPHPLTQKYPAYLERLNYIHEHCP